MGSFNKIRIEIVICEDRTAYRRDAYGLVDHAHFLEHFCHEAVGNPVRTAGAVMGRGLGEAFGSVVN
jgi:hypothetical protein